MSHDLDRLIDQSVWANLTWVDFVYGQPDPEPRPRELLGHIMFGEKLWFERVDGLSRAAGNFPVLTRDELVAAFHENAKTYRRLMATRYEDVIDFTRLSGVTYHARVADVIQHVLTHGYHHRGQLATHYARAGVKYPGTDHIDWLIAKRL